MKTQLVEIVVIADRSGSMATIKDDAIGGFNTFLEEQQAQKGKANLTLVLFDDKYETPIEKQPIKKVKKLTGKTFVPRGMTAMNDAIGRTLAKLEEEAPKKAIICILTDGEENSSHEFNTEQVKEMITAAEKRGWKVVYLAANQNAFAVGSTLGVSAISTVNYAATGAGIRSAYASTSSLVSGYRETDTKD